MTPGSRKCASIAPKMLGHTDDLAFTESVVEDAALAWAVKVESRTLAALGDTLLPKLISGELRMKDMNPLRSRHDAGKAEVP